jgi:hypothetical protein
MDTSQLINLLKKYPYPELLYEQIERLLPNIDNKTRSTIILNIFRQIQLDFPYGHYFINDISAKKKLEILKKYKPLWNHEKYFINPSELSIDKQYSLFYNQKYMLFIPNDTEYFEIDNLTCAFTDQSRMTGFRYILGINTRSPKEGWYQYGEYTSDAINDCLDKKMEINAFNLREGLYAASKVRYCPYTECAHERLTFLKSVFEQIYNDITKLEFRIFDLCAGWGDRLLVSIALNAEYIGVEPNSNSYPGFQRMIELLGNSEKQMILVDSCPSVKLPEYCIDGYFSICFLSPPAYNSEFYSNDTGQSINMFSDYNVWLIEFLFKTIDLAWKKLAVGGVLIIQSLLAAKINTYINNMCNGSIYFGAISVKTGKNRNKPLWIWKKNNLCKKTLDYVIMNKTFGKDIVDKIL